MSEMGECGNKKINMEHPLKYGTNSTPIHHSTMILYSTTYKLLIIIELTVP